MNHNSNNDVKFLDLVREVAEKYGVTLTPDVVQDEDGRWRLILRPGECFLRDVEALRQSDEFEIIGLEWSRSNEAWYHSDLLLDVDVYDVENDEETVLDWFVEDGGADWLLDAESISEALTASEFVPNWD